MKSVKLWRTTKTEEGILMGIYDGKVWKEFLSPDAVPFLSLPYNFALCLNVDWFQPFKNTCYSVGAMYISVLNLPRNERYALNNVILLGIIPGPNEPKINMNSYLQPLVNDLLTFWKGVVIPSAFGSPVFVRAALICTSCDIPASQKVLALLDTMLTEHVPSALMHFLLSTLEKNQIIQELTKDILAHYDCCLLFVKVVSILCQHKITVSDLQKGEKLLMEFCETFQSLYGKSIIQSVYIFMLTSWAVY